MSALIRSLLQNTGTLLAGIVVASLGVSAARAQLLGPSPYLSFNDSPFNGTNFSSGYFYLETFEDGLFNVPGVTGISNTPGTTLGVVGNGPTSDSVDGDDGTIDGFGRQGRQLAEINNASTDSLGYTFVFNAAQLGALPTHVGIVWTDGSPSTAVFTQLDVYGANNQLIGTVGPFRSSDNGFDGGTAEDRFVGAIHAGGISRIVIRSPGGQNNMGVDHLQYGSTAVVAAAPEPGAIALLGTAAFPLIGVAPRRRKATPPRIC